MKTTVFSHILKTPLHGVFAEYIVPVFNDFRRNFQDIITKAHLHLTIVITRIIQVADQKELRMIF